MAHGSWMRIKVYLYIFYSSHFTGTSTGTGTMYYTVIVIDCLSLLLSGVISIPMEMIIIISSSIFISSFFPPIFFHFRL